MVSLEDMLHHPHRHKDMPHHRHKDMPHHPHRHKDMPHHLHGHKDMLQLSMHHHQTVDQDRSGRISSNELQTALMNNKMKQFNSETCRLMIGMFDKDSDGLIDMYEFSALWAYIQQWRQCFDSFDTDRSGNIDANELLKALHTFGYRLSHQFCQLIVRLFDRSSVNTIDFDDFIQVSVMLKNLTDKFRQKDTHQKGIVQLGYEEFLVMALDGR
ncbi:sorcin-like isoform X2 [Styela clava]